MVLSMLPCIFINLLFYAFMQNFVSFWTVFNRIFEILYTNYSYKRLDKFTAIANLWLYNNILIRMPYKVEM